MRKAAPINIIVHYPTTEEGWRELRRRVAEVHADVVTNYIRNLKCPPWQKIKLVDAIIEDARSAVDAGRCRAPQEGRYAEPISANARHKDKNESYLWQAVIAYRPTQPHRKFPKRLRCL